MDSAAQEGQRAPLELATLRELWHKQYVKGETAASEAVALALLNLDETISKE